MALKDWKKIGKRTYKKGNKLVEVIGSQVVISKKQTEYGPEFTVTDVVPEEESVCLIKRPFDGTPRRSEKSALLPHYSVLY